MPGCHPPTHAAQARVTEKAAREQQFQSSMHQIRFSDDEICPTVQYRPCTGAHGACSRDENYCSQAAISVIDPPDLLSDDEILSNVAVPTMHRSTRRMLA